MPNKEQAFVAIIGGFFDLDANAKLRATEYAKTLGRALAEAGTGLVVYFSDDNSLEPHVVEGYVAGAPADAPDGSIRVRYPESQKDDVKFKEQKTRPRLFDPKLMPLDDWEAPFYRSLVEPGGADAVLLMAGKRSVLIAGQIAIARRLPTLAINDFDGAAAIIWRELSQTVTGYPTSSTSTAAQLVEWLKRECRVRRLEQERTELREVEYRRLTNSTLSTWFTAGAAALLLLILVLGVRQSPPIDSYAVLMFAGLVVAGATGALARGLVWGRSFTVATSVVLGGIAGLVVGLAYLIPQLIGAPGVFNPVASAVTATDKIQFVSALLTALSAGVGFDTVFDRLKSRAAEVSIAPQAGK